MLEKIKNKILNKNKTVKLTKSLDKNISIFEELFKNNDAIIYRTFTDQTSNKRKYCVIFCDGMCDKSAINEYIISPIMKNEESRNDIDDLLNDTICYSSMKRMDNLEELVDSILYGDTVLLFESENRAAVLDTKGWEIRSISEPESEVVVRGPREGFTESINVNLSLIRRKILSKDLKYKYKILGTQTKTKICICYMQNIASDPIIKELEKRLDNIDIDGILESGYIEELIRDEPLSPFNTIGYTERPDIVAANLLEGKIALICDGTPAVLTLPFLFIEYFQANEDYYNNFIYASINRMLRYVGFFLTTSTPAIYLALVTYHQEMIPTPLLISISAAREGVPFPTVFEAIAMTFVFEVLREAGVRLPKPIGATISIVGALVLGDAAVNARFVSAPIVIIIALTGISSFLVPKMLGPVLIIRIIFLLLASFLGLYGYIFGVIGLFIHLMSMRSFGIPYMMDLVSTKLQDIKDTSIRAPWWYMQYRPKFISSKNRIRKKNSTR
ncbi:spore germination protein [Tepidibacter hydrothermalis]|uniref:Spore germination protein n=1 Tax=Tepidibacter hydrothermalis TaxID=3036126 RepID=A0ABY8E7W3_9FIRM|nr:spore germination protein [Tepidibacter hydrothermalis]WFD08996.1 spore germination protein [Tepidibacter hydrothermalis]